MDSRGQNIESLVADLTLLSETERDQIMNALLRLKEEGSGKKAKISQLAGLGKEMWQGIDTADYLRQLRAEWDERKL